MQVMVCGDDKYSLYREIACLVFGSKVESLDEESVNDFVNSAMLYGEKKTPVITCTCSNAKSILEFVKGSIDNAIYHVTDGDEKTTSLLSGFFNISKKFWMPKTYKLEKYCVDFCMSEASRFGKSMGENVASTLVSVSGTNTWFLSNEILKLSTLSDVEGTNSIRIDHLSKTISRIGDYSFDQLFTSLWRKDPKMVSRELSRIESTTSGDPTPRVVRFMVSHISRLAVSSYLRSTGKKKDDIADELGLNRWYYSNKIHSDNWEHKDVMKVLNSISIGDRLVLSGSVSPWRYLSSSLVRACL